MLSVMYRKMGVRLTHVYFATEAEVDSVHNNAAGDVIFLHGVDKDEKVEGFLLSEQHTLIKDLSLSEGELLEGLSKHLKKHIRRNYKENVQIDFYTSKEILENRDVLSKCKQLYEKMFLDKGMEASFNTRLAEEYCKYDSLLIILVNVEGKTVGFWATIIQGENARSWVSAFDFRNPDLDSQLLSRTHKRVIWDALLHCRSKGVTCFDFGGVNSFDEPNGIAKFKMEFESENKVTYRNYLIPRTLLGKLAVKVFKGRWR